MAAEIKKCIIIGSAPSKEESMLEELDFDHSFVICADGGYDTARRWGIQPDLIIGDFDSLRSELPEGLEIIRLAVEKDDPDMMAALRVALERGYRDFVLVGALGGDRFDHTYANLSALQFVATQGGKAMIADGNTKVFLLPGGRLTLKDLAGSTVGVFPFGCPSCTVSYEGLKYPLHHDTLYSEVPLGVSNSIVAPVACITVHRGNALIILIS